VWECRLPSAGVRGRDADFMLLDLDDLSGDTSPVQVEVHWGTEGGSMKMEATGPRLLVPLGANPLWLLNDSLQQVRIEVRDPHYPDAKATVRSVSFFRMKPLLSDE
jgi:hypothetical protein